MLFGVVVALSSIICALGWTEIGLQHAPFYPSCELVPPLSSAINAATKRGKHSTGMFNVSAVLMRDDTVTGHDESLFKIAALILKKYLGACTLFIQLFFLNISFVFPCLMWCIWIQYRVMTVLFSLVYVLLFVIQDFCVSTLKYKIISHSHILTFWILEKNIYHEKEWSYYF